MIASRSCVRVAMNKFYSYQLYIYDQEEVYMGTRVKKKQTKRMSHPIKVSSLERKQGQTFCKGWSEEEGKKNKNFFRLSFDVLSPRSLTPQQWV